MVGGIAMLPTHKRSGVGAIQPQGEREARQEHNATTRQREGATSERNACKSWRDRWDADGRTTGRTAGQDPTLAFS